MTELIVTVESTLAVLSMLWPMLLALGVAAWVVLILAGRG